MNYYEAISPNGVLFYGYKSDYGFFRFGGRYGGQELHVDYAIYSEYLEMMGARDLFFYYFERSKKRILHEYKRS